LAASLLFLVSRFVDERDKARNMKILVLNSGSSSQKACLYEIGDTLPESPPECLWEGRVEWSGGAAAISVRNAHGTVQKQTVAVLCREEIVRELLATAWSGNTQAIASSSEIDVVGHRVVHGGPRFEEPAVLTSEVRSAIESAAPFAPLHIRAEMEGVDTIARLLGGIPQIAVFDTGFHRHMPDCAAVYPGPYEWVEKGIRRYGFHGINHQYCAARAAQILGKSPATLRLVICHLGNGCSAAAIAGGRSVDTTMGFTPLEGLVMGTRSGSVDPGILTFLMRQEQLTGDEIDELLNHRSGLLGLSGRWSDMRDILAAMDRHDRRAKLAFDVYIHRVRQAVGAMAAVLGGIDALVFTAGVGENAVAVRTEVCRPLEFLGLKLDPEANAHPKLDQDIATSDSRVRIIVIRAQEDWAIATECWRLVRTSQAALYEQQATDQDAFKSVCQNDKLSPRKLKMSGSTGIPHNA
jgi:acetate kinase